MTFQKAYIPYGGYWSTPFAKWQGSFASLHAIKFAGETAKRALEERQISAQEFTSLYLGMTIPTTHALYGSPWLAALIGAEELTGPMFAQACATSARVIGSAAAEVEAGNGAQPNILCITADRTSNGPQVIYPNPMAPGGKVESEHWVLDNFAHDPHARNSMLETAERVAGEEEITTQAQHEAVLLRHEQYQMALENDSAFHKRYMVTPIEVNPSGRKVLGVVDGDEGVFPTTAEGVQKLRPVLPDGSITFAGQTYPADGNAGMIITGRQRAKDLSRDKNIEIQILGFAEGRAEKGYMPKANVPAVKRVLENAAVKLSDVAVFKTHNPFAVNDIYLSRELGIPLERFNNYGSSLIWGHPQGPTGMRLIIEMIEELALIGGGIGLFTGCAAGDTAAAVVLKVEAA
ncbi:MAG: thiolase family protein [Anaerolineae bacterium]|nr:thiolase family protein [Anaerolineae bacterium]